MTRSDLILRMLAGGPKRFGAFVDLLVAGGYAASSASMFLCRLRAAGRVRQLRRGVWTIT